MKELTRIIKRILNEANPRSDTFEMEPSQQGQNTSADKKVYWYIIDEYNDESQEISVNLYQFKVIVNIIISGKHDKQLDHLLYRAKINLDAVAVLKYIVSENAAFLKELERHDNYVAVIHGNDISAFSLKSMQIAKELAEKEII